MKRRRQQWTIAQVYGKRPTALVVWTALCDMADERGSSVLTPTRAHLSGLTGITRHKTISAALTTLEKAGWVDRVHVPVSEHGKRTATLLRIVLRRRGRSAPLTVEAKRDATTKGRLRRGRSAPLTGAHAVEGAQRPKGRGRSAPLDSSKEEGAPLAGFEAGGVAGRDPVPSEHPAACIEREKMAAVRAKREADGNGQAQVGDRHE